jgi:hypothetical protein
MNSYDTRTILQPYPVIQRARRCFERVSTPEAAGAGRVIVPGIRRHGQGRAIVVGTVRNGDAASVRRTASRRAAVLVHFMSSLPPHDAEVRSAHRNGGRR